MKKWAVGITVMFNLDAESKKDAVQQALNRLEANGEVGYMVWAQEVTSDDSDSEKDPEDDRPEVLRQLEDELGIT